MLLCFEECRKSSVAGIIGRKNALCKKQLVKNEVSICRLSISGLLHLFQSEQTIARRGCCCYA